MILTAEGLNVAERLALEFRQEATRLEEEATSLIDQAKGLRTTADILDPPARKRRGEPTSAFLRRK